MTAMKRTARELRDRADEILFGADAHAGPEFRDGIKLAHELICLADITDTLERADHYRAQDAREEAESEYRKLAEKYEAALNSILGVRGTPADVLHEISRQAAVALRQAEPPRVWWKP